MSLQVLTTLLPCGIHSGCHPRNGHLAFLSGARNPISPVPAGRGTTAWASSQAIASETTGFTRTPHHRTDNRSSSNRWGPTTTRSDPTARCCLSSPGRLADVPGHNTNSEPREFTVAPIVVQLSTLAAIIPARTASTPAILLFSPG